jgi:hypothetical protein
MIPTDEAPRMVYRRETIPPAGHEPLELKGSARGGMWWERSDGLVVRMAAPERERAVERSRLSLLGMAVALIASGNVPRE